MAAKTRTMAPIIIAAPPRRAPLRQRARAVARRAGAAVGRGAKKAGRRVVRAAGEEAHTLVAIGAGVALGLAKRFDLVKYIPRLPVIGASGTLGLASWGLGKFVFKQGKAHQIASHAATGLLAIAGHNIAAGDEAAAGEGDDDDDGRD